MRLKAIQDTIISKMVKQNLDPNSMDVGKEHYASGNMIRKEIKIKEGLDKEAAKKIVKAIKDSGLKVEVIKEALLQTSKTNDKDALTKAYKLAGPDHKTIQQILDASEKISTVFCKEKNLESLIVGIAVAKS